MSKTAPRFTCTDDDVLTDYHGSYAEVKIPDDVVEIAAGVFRDRKSIRRLVLPKSLKTIGVEAFAGCIHLEEVVGGCTLNEIGEGAFAGTPWLLRQGDYPMINGVLAGRPGWLSGELALPKGVRVIPKGMFCGCTGITGISLPEGLEKIGAEAFADCVNLKRVQVPEGLEAVEDNAFCRCIGLEHIDFPRSLNQIHPNAFQGCSALQEISLQRVSIVGYGAFQDCTALTRVKLSQFIIGLGSFSFRNCTSLEEVVIPYGVTTLYNDAFSGCTKLRKVTLPDTLQEIDERVFFRCTALEKIKLPDMLESIKSCAFAECSSLRYIRVPYRTVLGEGAFANSGLETVKLDRISTIPKYCFKHCASLKKVEITGDMKRMEEGAFLECIQLQQINIPNQVEFIGDMAFGFCSSVQLRIPSSLRELGTMAFGRCESLQKVTIPGGLRSIGDRAFINCTGLQRILLRCDSSFAAEHYLGCLAATVEVPKGHRQLQPVGDGLVLSRDGETLVWCDRVAEGVVRIPDGVTVIGEYAFWGCAKITQVVLPESLRSISKYGFAYCKRLAKVQIPNHVQSIGEQAFSGCSALRMATLPESLKTIGKSAFEQTALTELTIPDKVQEVGEKIVQGCPIQRVTVLSATVAFQGGLLDPEPPNMELVTAQFSPKQLPVSKVSWVRGYFGQLQRGERLPDRRFSDYIRRHCRDLWADPICLRGMLQYQLLPAGMVQSALDAAAVRGNAYEAAAVLEYQRNPQKRKRRTRSGQQGGT